MGRPKGWASRQTGRPVEHSPGRPGVGRREHRRRFWAAVARGLSSEAAGIEVGVSPSVGNRWFRNRPIIIAYTSGSVTSGLRTAIVPNVWRRSWKRM